MICFCPKFDYINGIGFFFREHHQRSLINDIISILSDILNEEASQPLLDVILGNLLKEGKVSFSVVPCFYPHVVSAIIILPDT